MTAPKIPSRSAFYASLAVVTAVCVGLIWSEGRTEQRYSDAPCQYQIIHDQTLQAGLVSIGGSRVYTATDAIDFNKVLRASGIDHGIMVNASHSHFNIEKEYVLIRDLLEQQPTPRSLLVMMQPRRMSRAGLHPDFEPLAKLSDIPLAMRAFFAEGAVDALAVPSKVLVARITGAFSPTRIGTPQEGAPGEVKDFIAPESPRIDCHANDLRLDLRQLQIGAAKRETNEAKTVKWQLSSLRDRYHMVYIKRLKALADTYDVPLFFIYLPRPSQSLPKEGFAETFLAETGVPLITPDPELQKRLNRGGRRDLTHINAAGRAYFLPWLQAEIEAACPAGRQCL